MASEAKRVLVATDFSTYATRTQHAAGWLCAQHHSHITLVYVLETLPFLFPENKLTPNLLRELVKVTDVNLRKQAHMLSDKYGISVDTHVVCGNPAQEILKVIAAEQADIVIAALDENHSEESSCKRVAQRIASKTDCPVLTLKMKRRLIPFGTANVIKTKISMYAKSTHVKP